MSAIKDLYDLGKDLKESVTDRQTLDLIMPILNKIEEVKDEHFQLQNSILDNKDKQFESKRKLDKEMFDLKDEITSLKEENSKLKSNNIGCSVSKFR